MAATVVDGTAGLASAGLTSVFGADVAGAVATGFGVVVVVGAETAGFAAEAGGVQITSVLESAVVGAVGFGLVATGPVALASAGVVGDTDRGFCSTGLVSVLGDAATIGVEAAGVAAGVVAVVLVTGFEAGTFVPAGD